MMSSSIWNVSKFLIMTKIKKLPYYNPGQSKLQFNGGNSLGWL